MYFDLPVNISAPYPVPSNALGRAVPSGEAGPHAGELAIVNHAAARAGATLSWSVRQGF